jgi:zinc/manganese transport system permease protein
MDAGSALLLLLPSLALCILMVGMLSYLGLHVIKREIIFVDLALAQIAALGSLLGFMLGIPLHTTASQLFAVALTTIAAGIFALSRTREGRVPQEALIGLAYAIAAAGAIILIDKAPHGAEHIKDLLTGSILWVSWGTVGMVAVVYAAAGLFHFACRRRLLLISENPIRAEAQGIHVRLWDFLFYLSFGVVITVTVGTAGVLLVFIFLVAPAVMAVQVTDRLGRQLLLGWSLGVVATVVGLFVSYVGDLSSGPVVIGAYAAAIVALSVVVYNLRAPDRREALRNTVLVGAALVVAFGALLGVGARVGRHTDHEGHSDLSSAPPPGAVADADAGPEVLAANVLRAVEANPLGGLDLAEEFLRGGPPAFFAALVTAKLDSAAGLASGYDPGLGVDAPHNQNALRTLRKALGREGAKGMPAGTAGEDPGSSRRR